MPDMAPGQPLQTGPVNTPARTVGIVPWFLMVVSFIAVVARLSSKWAVRRRLYYDDFWAIASLAFCIGSTTAVAVGAAHQFGIDQTALSFGDVEKFEKSIYAMTLLYIPTLVCAKASILQFLKSSTPVVFHKRFATATGIFLGVWFVCAEFAAAFQCQVPQTWRSGPDRCINRAIFWRVTAVISILTEMALIALPFMIIYGLRTSLRRRAVAFAYFGARIFDIGATGASLAFTQGWDSANLTRDLYAWTILSQTIQTLTIVTSCLPYLRPLQEMFTSGMFVSDELRRRGYTSEGNMPDTGGAYPRNTKANPSGGKGSKDSKGTKGSKGNSHGSNQRTSDKDDDGESLKHLQQPSSLDNDNASTPSDGATDRRSSTLDRDAAELSTFGHDGVLMKTTISTSLSWSGERDGRDSRVAPFQ